MPSRISTVFVINTSRPRQNLCHFVEDIFECIVLNENFRILIKVSLNFILNGQIENTPASVKIKVWPRIGDAQLSMMA